MTLFLACVHEEKTVAFLCTSAGANTKLGPRSDPRRRGKKGEENKSDEKDEEKSLIKTSSAGVCCLTAVCVFTQACIITVCLVCRSSQKLFRSPGV